VSENGVLRRIFGLNGDEVTEVWRRLHNEELYGLYASPCIFLTIKARRMKWVWHLAHVGERRNAFRVLVGKPGRKRPFGRHRSSWKDNIKINIKGIRCWAVKWIDVFQDRRNCRADASTVMGLRLP